VFAKGKTKNKTVDKVLLVDVSQTTSSRGDQAEIHHRAWAGRSIFAWLDFLLDSRCRFI